MCSGRFKWISKFERFPTEWVIGFSLLFMCRSLISNNEDFDAVAFLKRDVVHRDAAGFMQRCFDCVCDGLR